MQCLEYWTGIRERGIKRVKQSICLYLLLYVYTLVILVSHENKICKIFRYTDRESVKNALRLRLLFFYILYAYLVINSGHFPSFDTVSWSQGYCDAYDQNLLRL